MVAQGDQPTETVQTEMRHKPRVDVIEDADTAEISAEEGREMLFVDAVDDDFIEFAGVAKLKSEFTVLLFA